MKPTTIVVCILLAGLSSSALAADAGAIDAGAVAAVADVAASEAPAAAAAPAELVGVPSYVTPEGAALSAYVAFKSGKWLAAVGGALLLLALIARRIVAYFAADWAASKTGGKVIGGATTFVGYFGFELGRGTELSVPLFIVCAALAGVAAGWWSMAPNMIKGMLRPKSAA